MTEVNIERLKKYISVFNLVKKETARGAIIMACAYLDHQLRDLISLKLIDNKKAVDEFLGSDKGFECPLSHFASRIKAAYCLGLIDKAVYHDLNELRKIRNPFTHETDDYTYDHPDIVKWCESIRMSKVLLEGIPDFSPTHRNLFLVGITQLVFMLEVVTEDVEVIPKPVPINYEPRNAITLGEYNKQIDSGQKKPIAIASKPT